MARNESLLFASAYLSGKLPRALRGPARLPSGPECPPSWERALELGSTHVVSYISGLRLFSLEAPLPFLKTRSHLKVTVNVLNLVRSVKPKPENKWPLCVPEASM